MDDLNPVLSKYPPDCQPTSVESLGSAGGMSGAQFWRVATPRGLMALRRWPREHPTPERLRYIHAVLQHAADHGFGALPLPVTTSAGGTFVTHAGFLWELAPWMPGTADYSREPSMDKFRAAVRTLAQFHLAMATFPTMAGADATKGMNAVQRHFLRVSELSAERINDLAATITDFAWPQLAPSARRFVTHLPTAVPRALAQLEPLRYASLPRQVCLKDIWHDHVLFTGSEVSAIVDFGAVAIDTLATDIARLLSSLVSVTPLPFREGQGEGSVSRTTSPQQLRSEALAAYNDVRPLSPQEVAAARALEVSGTILAGCNWIRWIYTDGRTFENPTQVIERFARLLKRLLQSDQDSLP